MIWRDLLIQATVADESVATALSQAFGVPISEVFISEVIDTLADQILFCLKSHAPGGSFNLVLSIYLAFEPGDDRQIVMRFADALGQPVLMADDETSDPYVMVLVEPGRNPTSVAMVMADLDDGRYNMAASHVDDMPAYYVTSDTRSVPGLSQCPRAGYWFTPSRKGSRRYFEAGESMPDFGGDYGATLWQWDEHQ